jgi:UDP-N-acetylmuramyl pentapeptide phosphotransferase/UDP-N-acetylglucosamine-1-phosphate transferase
MGDCGSQTLGLILAYFAISFSMAKPESLETLAAFSGPQDDIVSLEEVLLTTPLVVAFSIIMIPVLDTFRVFGNRILAHKDPFLPDRTHIHHRFIDLGLSHRATLVVILMLAAFFVLLNLLLLDLLDINLLFCLDLLLWTGMHVWISACIGGRARKKSA